MAGRLPIALAAFGAACILAAPVLAQAVPPGREGALGALLPPIPGRSVCFARRYDAKHLAAHPAQTITAMVLRIRYHRHEPEQALPQGQRSYYFTLALDRRGRKGRLTTSGECGPRGDAIVCGVECDGGGFGLKAEAGGTVLVDLTRFGRLRLGRSCDDEEGVEVTPGRDDRSFRLEPVEASQCAVPDE